MADSVRELVEERKELIEAIVEVSDMPVDFSSMLGLWLALEAERGFEGWPSLEKSEEKFLGDELAKDLEGQLPSWVWIPGFVSISGSSVYLQEDKERIPDDVDIVLRAGVDRETGRFSIEVDDAFALKLLRSLENALEQPLSLDWHSGTYGPNWPFIRVYDLVLVPRKELEVEWLDEEEFAEAMYKEFSTEELYQLLGGKKIGTEHSGHYGHRGRPPEHGGSAPSVNVSVGSLAGAGIEMVKEEKYEKGFFESYQVLVEGDGRAIAKPDKQFAGKRLMACEVLGYEVAQALGYETLVPTTVFHSIEGRPGSLQLWVENADTGYDSKHWNDVPEREVKQMAILDALLANWDRKDANMLITRSGHLKAIDHGVCFGTGKPELGRMGVWDGQWIIKRYRKATGRRVRPPSSRDLAPVRRILENETLLRNIGALKDGAREAFESRARYLLANPGVLSGDL